MRKERNEMKGRGTGRRGGGRKRWREEERDGGREGLRKERDGGRVG